MKMYYVKYDGLHIMLPAANQKHARKMSDAIAKGYCISPRSATVTEMPGGRKPKLKPKLAQRNKNWMYS